MVTIYAIVCTATAESYIGCTAGKVSKRFREHRCLAKNGKHHSPKLIERWAQYGDDGFKAVSLELLADDATLQHKREAELRWLEKTSKEGLLLNKAIISFAPTPEATRSGIEASRHVAGNRWTPETNQKRRMAQLGIPKGHGAKISATKQAKKLMR